MYYGQFADYSVCLKFRHAADIGNYIAIVVYKVFYISDIGKGRVSLCFFVNTFEIVIFLSHIFVCMNWPGSTRTVTLITALHFVSLFLSFYENR